MICRHYFVSGRVQGVYFRGSTQRQAQSLDITGWVRNLSDGRVEVLACGDAVALDKLENWLRIGPQWANVSNIEISNEQPAAIPPSFEVR
jgi:acylphosphatase